MRGVRHSGRERIFGQHAALQNDLQGASKSETRNLCRLLLRKGLLRQTPSKLKLQEKKQRAAWEDKDGLAEVMVQKRGMQIRHGPSLARISKPFVSFRR